MESSTSLTWIRGIFQKEFGLNPKEIKWIVSSKDSSAKAAGKVSKQEKMRLKRLANQKKQAQQQK